MRRSLSSSGLLQDPREAQDNHDDDEHDEHPEDGAEFGRAGEEGMHVRNDTDGCGMNALQLVDELREQLERDAHTEQELRIELEGYQIALSDDECLKCEIKTLRDFIADVRLGLRDLSEYEDICGRAWV
jgi:hypothetical protein